MAVTPMFRRHDAAAQTRYQELKQLARSQSRVLAGTPGSLKQRTQSGRKYWVREYIRVDGAKTDEYLGPVLTMDEERLSAWQNELAVAKALAAGSSTLRLFGYQRIDRKPAAILAALRNRGLFAAGLTLVGSHAFGVLLNDLGVSAAGYKTQDIDLGRGRALDMALRQGESFPTLLFESGLRLVPVPGMPSTRPSTSYKVPGADTLAVDLLVAGDAPGQVAEVRELGAYAQCIPWLDFLVADAVESVALSPNQVIPVSVPLAERFAVHKLFSSQSRTWDRDKSRKDLMQAALIGVALEEETPGRLMESWREFPAAARSVAAPGAQAAAALLGPANEGAREAFSRMVARRTRRA